MIQSNATKSNGKSHVKEKPKLEKSNDWRVADDDKLRTNSEFYMKIKIQCGHMVSTVYRSWYLCVCVRLYLAFLRATHTLCILHTRAADIGNS